MGGPRTFILPYTVQGGLNIALVFVAHSLLGIVTVLLYKEDCALVRMQVCKPRSCTHVWSTCSFLGLCVIKDIKRSGVVTEPAKGQGPLARNWWCKRSPQLVVICKAANIKKISRLITGPKLLE